MKKHKVFLPPSKIPLIVAAEKGWAEGVDILLKHGASVNQTTTKGWSALHYTMMKGSVQDVEKRTKCADMLIKAGADVNRKDVQGCTVLMAMVGYGCVEITDLLLKNGADVNLTSRDGWSALHYTTMIGSVQDVEERTKCADMLIKAGAHVNSKDVLGCTVLMAAVEIGCVGITDLLLKNGADVNLTNPAGWSALHCTTINGPVQDVEARTKCADMLIKAGADVNRKDVLGCTVLMAAVENGCVGITDLLLKNGADVNITNPGGASALHYTTKQGSLQDVEARTKCADMLIRAGADVNSKDVLGVPVLMVAVENGCEKITDLLLKNGADVNITNPAGASALHYTTKQGSLQDVEARTECADMLIRAGADVNSKDVLGFTALMVAVENGIKGLSKKLISVGADVNVSFSDGQTVLMKAIEKKQYDAAKFMIMEGAEIKAKQLEGNTKASNKLKEALKKKKEYDFTLHLNSRDAMRKHLMSLIPNSNLFTVVQKLGLNPWLKKYIVFGGHYECALDYTVRRCSTQGVEFQTKCADLLIKAGVDVNSANKEGTTALMTAVKNEFEQIAKLLIHAGANVNVSYSNGQTVLMKAIETKQWDVVKSLITEGVEIAPKLLEGNSALSIALNKALKKRKRNALYSNNRDVLRKELMSLIPTSNLMAMVQKLILEPQLKNYIIYGGHHKCLGVLLKSMLNVNESDDKGYTPLMHAAGKGHKECVQFLIKVGADLNTANLLGETAVMRAARKGYVGCVDLLIKSGAQVNALPLHKIPMCGSLFVVNLI